MKIQFPWQKNQLINACIALHELKLWNIYSGVDFFVVKTPDQAPVVTFIMGSGGMEYGIHINRGKDPFSDTLKLLKYAEKVTGQVEFIGITMVPYGELTIIEKKWFKSCNFRANKFDLVPVPMFRGKRRGPDLVDSDSDIKHLLYIIRGIINAHKDGLLPPLTVDATGKKLLTINVSGDVRNPDVKTGYELYPQARELLEYHTSMMLQDAQYTEKGDFTRTERAYVIIPLYEDVEEGSEDAPDVRIVVIDEPSEMILSADLISMSTIEAATALNAVFSKDGLPEKVTITDKEFLEVMADYFEINGVNAILDKEHKLIEKALEEFGVISNIDEMKKEIKASFVSVPASDDFIGWMRLKCFTIAELLDSWGLLNDKTEDKLCRKFFDEECWQDFFGRSQELLKSLVLWYAVEYRAKKNSKTILDKMMSKDIPVGCRAFFECLSNATVSLYQVEKVSEKKRKISVRDIFDDQQLVIDDIFMPENLNKGEYVPLWVYRCGDFFFGDWAGPAFDVDDFDDAMNYLVDQGLPSEPDKQWLRENVHIFGGLWSLLFDYHDDDNDVYDEDDDCDDELELSDSAKKEAVEKFFHKYYMDWIDKPLPALNYKAPRQAVKTPQGANQVRELIQNIPIPDGQFEIKIPKFEMLTELGLL